MDQTHDLIILSSLLYKSKGRGGRRALLPPLTTPVSLFRLFKSKLNFIIKENKVSVISSPSTFLSLFIFLS